MGMLIKKITGGCRNADVVSEIRERKRIGYET